MEGEDPECRMQYSKAHWSWTRWWNRNWTQADKCMKRHVKNTKSNVRRKNTTSNWNTKIKWQVVTTVSEQTYSMNMCQCVCQTGELGTVRPPGQTISHSYSYCCFCVFKVMPHQVITHWNNHQQLQSILLAPKWFYQSHKLGTTGNRDSTWI